jgi:hypothetical protein
LVDTVWVTVDRLIHDLGAIRAFVDEAEAVPGGSSVPQVAEVRGAMDVATDAITRIFSGSEEDAAIEAAWTAVARAQDAVARARGIIVAARAGQASAESMRELNRRQLARAREHSQIVSDQADRVRRRHLRPRPKTPGPPAGPDKRGS